MDFESLLTRIHPLYRPMSTPPREDVDAVERAWGISAPATFRTFLERFGGGALVGAGGVMEIWWTPSQLGRARERDILPFGLRGTRSVVFASDGGSHDYAFDVDGDFGRGAYAVLSADGASDLVEFIAPDFAGALERIAFGPRRDTYADEVVRVARRETLR
jgi:hypothetical protein